jgi:hypothetical protein
MEMRNEKAWDKPNFVSSLQWLESHGKDLGKLSTVTDPAL